MRCIRVELKDRSYPIWVGRDLLKKSGALIREAGVTGRALIVSQNEVYGLYGAALTESLTAAGFEVHRFITPRAKSSEAAKSEKVFWKLVKRIASLDGKNRPPFVVALGGGVVGDLAGFAAGIYRRGLPFIQVPTTLTAQVDSAIGGKTAIDIPEGKNLLGVIHQPRLVLSDPATLETLNDRLFADGSAEVIKYGMISDPSLVALLARTGLSDLRRSPKKLEDIIARSARIKARVVAKDELDRRDIRIVLNFGHTAGHGIEAASQYSKAYTHGEAVAIGMLVACEIAVNMGVLKDRGLTRRLEQLLLKFGLPLYFRGLTVETVMNAMGYDKKSSGGKIRFVLPTALGKTAVVRDVPTAAIREALEKRKA